MTRSSCPSRTFACVLLIALLSTLAACGGGGGDDVATANADTPPTTPTSPTDRTACFPDMATYDGLVLHMTPQDAVKHIGCAPFEPAPNTTSAQDKLYRWTDFQHGERSMELVFTGPRGLSARTAYFSAGDDKPSSSCEPTRAAFDQLQPYVTDLAAAVRAFGCDGELRVDILTLTGHQQRYAWGHVGDKTRPVVQLTFYRGQLSEKLAERLR